MTAVDVRSLFVAVCYTIGWCVCCCCSSTRAPCRLVAQVTSAPRRARPPPSPPHRFAASSGLILLNKYILSTLNFHYPLTLSRRGPVLARSLARPPPRRAL